MKKVSLFFALILVSLISNRASAQAFEKGTKLLDGGIEIVESLETSVVPVFVNFEVGVTEDIGVGAKTRFWSKYGVNSFALQALGNYHFGRLFNIPTDKLDPFAGVAMGFNRFSLSDRYYLYYDDESSITSFMFSTHAGARYYFTERFGAMAKLGVDLYRIDDIGETDVSLALGVTFKF